MKKEYIATTPTQYSLQVISEKNVVIFQDHCVDFEGKINKLLLQQNF
jgi:hypothetical protein